MSDARQSRFSERYVDGRPGSTTTQLITRERVGDDHQLAGQHRLAANVIGGNEAPVLVEEVGLEPTKA